MQYIYLEALFVRSRHNVVRVFMGQTTLSLPAFLAKRKKNDTRIFYSWNMKKEWNLKTKWSKRRKNKQNLKKISFISLDSDRFIAGPLSLSISGFLSSLVICPECARHQKIYITIDSYMDQLMWLVVGWGLSVWLFTFVSARAYIFVSLSLFLHISLYVYVLTLQRQCRNCNQISKFKFIVNRGKDTTYWVSNQQRAINIKW